MERQIKRGDIYYADLDPVIGSEQGDNRPVLIVQNNTGNRHSPTVIITSITGKLSKNPLPTHVPLSTTCGLEKDSLALMEQIRAIDRSRLGNYIGQVEQSILPVIDRALSVCVGLQEKKQTPLFLSLCPRCESDFRKSGYMLVKKNWQENKEICDFCNSRNGLTFGIFNTQ